MQSNKAKAKLRAGEVVFGSEIMFPSADVGRDPRLRGTRLRVHGHGALGHHAREPRAHDPRLRDRRIDAARAHPRERAGRYPGVILRILDLGAMGVIVPHVDTREEAKAVVDAVKYAPTGRRGMFDVGRQTGYGTRMSAPEYVKRANEETLVVVMIESTEGLANVRRHTVGGRRRRRADRLRPTCPRRWAFAATSRRPRCWRPSTASWRPRASTASRPASGRSPASRPSACATTCSSGAQFVNITTQTLLLAGVRHWKERLLSGASGG